PDVLPTWLRLTHEPPLLRDGAELVRGRPRRASSLLERHELSRRHLRERRRVRSGRVLGRRGRRRAVLGGPPGTLGGARQLRLGERQPTRARLVPVVPRVLRP